ncbi:hypothetical protein ACWG0P_12085 [Amedibacillus sp. YH-ame6]
MRKFVFEKQDKPELLKLEINGKNFTFNPMSLSVKKASEKFVKGQEFLVKRIKKGNMSKEEVADVVYKSCDLVRESVNYILGKGSYDKIFDGRTIDFEENQKLITFLFQEITEFTKKKIVALPEVDHEHLTEQVS